MNQKEKLQRYGSHRNDTLNYGDLPPPYEKVVSSSWTAPKTIAVAGFILIQVVLLGSIINQLYMEKANSGSIVPEQIHLSLGKNDSEYYVSWATDKAANCHLVWHKKGSLITRSVQGNLVDSLFQDGPEDTKKPYVNTLAFGDATYNKYFYHAKMTITPGETYLYYIASTQVEIVDTGNQTLSKQITYLSDRYEFRAVPFEDEKRPLSLIFYGDLGLVNAQSVPRLTEEVLSYKHDLIIHNGDFAYDLDTDRGRYGDKFMRLMEPIAARIPYQTAVGNHEVKSNFSHYDKRFNMINRGPINHGVPNNFYYSFNAGPIHFIALSTEFWYFLEYSGIAPLATQFDWLIADLKVASSPTERAKRPWIVVFGHRPMYCSSRDNDDCSKDSNLLRRGLPFAGSYALEKLLYDYGVDLELYSHEHQYERFLPIYDGKVYNGTDKLSDPYHNPRAPVHLISGSAGCQEKLDPFVGQPVIGSVKQISDYGYTKIQATRCKLHLEQVSDDQAGTVVDVFTISKNRQNFPPTSSNRVISYKDC